MTTENMSKPNPKERAAKAKATLEAKAQNYKSQTIRINEDWSVVRVDDLNWQVKQKGRKEPWDRWYFGSVKCALYGVFEKALNEQPQKWLANRSVIDLRGADSGVHGPIGVINVTTEPTGSYRSQIGKPTAGEWTVERLLDELNNPVVSHEALAWTVKQINAALAAERERLEKQWGREGIHITMERLTQELAAERDENWRHAYDNLLIDYTQLREQRDEAIRLLEYKEKQLAASEAAMKEAIEQPYHVDAYRILEEALNGDTAALDAAIAAAQKPLVDALKLARRATDESALQCSSHRHGARV